MLKSFLGLLLLANGVLLAYNAGYLGNGGTEGREPARTGNQVNARFIRLVDPLTSAAPVPDGAAVVLAVSPAMASATDVIAVIGHSCIEIGNFDAADALRFDRQVAPLGLGERLTRRALPDAGRYLVYIPPLADKDSADRKAAELRKLGIDDFFVLANNSNLRWGISLGLFKSEDAAHAHLDNLARQGVHSAKVIARPAAVGRTIFQLRGLDVATSDAIDRIRQDFPRQEMHHCSAT